MLEQGVDRANYLVTTDLRRPDRKTGVPTNLYSWCSFLTSPDQFGYPYPKAPFNAYKMVAELTGTRVEATASGGNTRVFAAADPTNWTLRIMLWNFATYIPELKPPIEEGKTETVKLKITNAELPPDAKAVLRIVDKEHGDIFSAVQAGRPANLAAAAPAIKFPPLRRVDDKLEFELTMQPGSIAMLEIGLNPVVPSLLTPYPEKAEILLKRMRDNLEKQPEKTIEKGKELLQLTEVNPEQKIDALRLLVVAARKMQKPLAEIK